MKKYNEKKADSLDKNLQNDFFCRKSVWHKKLKEQTCRARICFQSLCGPKFHTLQMLTDKLLINYNFHMLLLQVKMCKLFIGG